MFVKFDTPEFSIPALTMQAHLDTLLAEASMTKAEHTVMTRLVSTMKLHTFAKETPPYFDDEQMMCMIWEAKDNKVSKEVLDQLCLRAVSAYLKEANAQKVIDLTMPLMISISLRLHQFAHFLLDQNLCMPADYPMEPGNPESCTTLVLKTLNYDQALFDKILSRDTQINSINIDGLNALFIAIYTRNQYAVEKILGHPKIDLRVSRHDMRLVCYNNVKQTVLTLVRTKVQDQNFVVPIPENQLFEFPLTWLSADNQARLRQFVTDTIATMPVFQNTELKKAFLRFLNAEENLPFVNMNRVSIAVDCILYLKNPELIHQNGTYLCGIACVMQHLAMSDPEKFIDSVIDIAELNQRKPTSLPERIKTIPTCVLPRSYHLAELWLQTVRNAYNTFLDYDSNSRFENIRGLTTPHHMVLMYQDFGFEVVKETSQVRVAGASTVVGGFFDRARQLVSSYAVLPEVVKVYSKHHREIQCDQARFKDLCESASRMKYLTLQLTPAFINKLVKLEIDPSILKLVEASHYVTLKNFTYNPEFDKVSFEYLTYGRCYSQDNFPAKEFMSGFLGLIEVDYKNKTNVLTIEM